MTFVVPSSIVILVNVCCIHKNHQIIFQYARGKEGSDERSEQSEDKVEEEGEGEG